MSKKQIKEMFQNLTEVELTNINSTLKSIGSKKTIKVKGDVDKLNKAEVEAIGNLLLVNEECTDSESDDVNTSTEKGEENMNINDENNQETQNIDEATVENNENVSENSTENVNEILDADNLTDEQKEAIKKMIEEKAKKEEEDKIKKEEEEKAKKERQEKAKQTREEKKNFLSQWKVKDNLMGTTEKVLVSFKDARKIGSNSYGIYLTARQIAEMWHLGQITYDPNAQRGTVLDKSGVLKSLVFEKHVNEIANAMAKLPHFEATQMSFGILDDKEEINEIEFDEETGDLIINGIIRITDGAHRSKACYIIWLAQEYANEHTNSTSPYLDVNLDEIVFNVKINNVDLETLRSIYVQIDSSKNLDKAQKTSLSNDPSVTVAKYVNSRALNNLIAPSTSSKNRVYIFSTFTEALKEAYGDINPREARELSEYVNSAYEYITLKFKDAFSTNTEVRNVAKDESLLGENIFAHGWMRVIFPSKGVKIPMEQIEARVDKIVSMSDFFRKDNPFWLEQSIVKHGSKKKDSDKINWTVSSTSSSYNKIRKIVGEKLEGIIVDAEINDKKNEEPKQNREVAVTE